MNIGDRVKLHPNKKQSSFNIDNVKYDVEYTVISKQKDGRGKPYCIIISAAEQKWSVYTYQLLKIGKGNE